MQVFYFFNLLFVQHWNSLIINHGGRFHVVQRFLLLSENIEQTEKLQLHKTKLKFRHNRS